MNEINPIMVQTLAKMTGKTEEEVLKFLEKKEGEQLIVPDLSDPQQPTVQKIELPKELPGKVIEDEVITEEVPLDQVTQEQLEDIESQDTFSASIRVGSKVRVVWEPNVGKGKIKWTGRTGTVLQKLSDSGISIYCVEFPAGKIPFQRINKKSGKLEKGYHTKKLQNWFDEANIEQVF